MKIVNKIAILLSVAIIAMFIMASCNALTDDLFQTFPEETTLVTPEVTTPEVITPDVTTPDVTTPEVTTPDVTTPEVTTPEVTTPEVTTPDVTTPEVTTPDVTTPEVTTPEVTTPEVTTPEVTTPEVTTPEVTTPEGTTPEGTTPTPHEHVIEILSAVEPTCTQQGLTEGKRCSTCGEILVAQEVISAQHNYVDGNCTVCKLTDTAYFNFILLDNGTYEIAAKDVNNLPTNFTIPNEYNGVAITKIADYAFAFCYNPTTITISEGITFIGDYAFYCAAGLQSITISKTVTDIHTRAFAECSGIETLTVASDNLVYYSEGNCLIEKGTNTLIVSEKYCNIPDCVTAIGPYSCSRHDYLVNMTVPNSIISIDEWAFGVCLSLKTIVIPSSVTQINDCAFAMCDSLAVVFYQSTENEWNHIDIGTENSYLTNAIRYYYSETKPTTSGNFWHYVDGVPTVWEAYDPEYFTFTLLEDGTYEIAAKDANNLPANLVIPGEYQGIAITKIADNAFYGSNLFNTTQSLTSVTIPEGITVIGEAAFGFCHNIETITLPSTLVTIEKDAFLKCYLLNNVTIPAAVTSIGAWAFANCESLTNIQILEGVTSIGDNAFYDCLSLVSIDLPESVVEIGYGVFIGCSSLVHVTIPEGETHWNSLFLGCSSLEEIVIPNSVEKFDICTFASCTALKKVIISSESSLKLISQDAFGGCANLTSIVIPKTVTKIEHNPFNLCTSLTAIYYAGSENDWNNIDFYLQENDIIFSITRYYYSETQPTTEGNFWHWVDNVPTIWEPYVAPENPGYSVGLEYTSNGDGTCYVSGVGTFMDSKLIIPSVAPDGKKIVGIGEKAFYNCSFITEITIPHSIVDIKYDAFLGCNSVSAAYIVVKDKTTNYAAQMIGYSFFGSFEPTKLYFVDEFGNEVTDITIAEGVGSIGYAAFAYSNITSLHIPQSVTYIDYYAFAGCENLVYFTGGEGIETVCRSAFGGIALHQYGGCTYVRFGDNPYYMMVLVEDFTLEEYVIHQDTKIIARGAFANCEMTRSVVLPANIRVICESRFFENSLIEGTYYGGTVEQWSNVIRNDGYGVVYDTFSRLYYYSETQPTTEGNFWHWVDGEPTVWEAYVEPNYSLGLEYTSNGDGTCYVSGIGTCTDTDIIIPTISPDGLTITGIGEYAFYNCNNITSIFIPATITSISYYAFSDGYTTCTALANITVDENNQHYCDVDGNLYDKAVTTIMQYAAGKTDTSFRIPNTVHTVGDAAFSGCKGFENLTIPGGIFTFGGTAFYDCPIENIYYEDILTYWILSNFNCEVATPTAFAKNLYINNELLVEAKMYGYANYLPSYGFVGLSCLTYVEIPSVTTTLGSYTLYNCSALKSILFDTNLNYIGSSAFEGCYNLDTIYYLGSELDWNNISIEEIGNECLFNATRYYYSKNQPTTEGNFWHWVDGEPTVWKVHVHTEEIIPAVNATCTTTGLTEGKKCSICDEVIVKQEIIPAKHKYENRICTVCGAVQYSEGLAFSSNTDGTCSLVGIGTCIDAELLIPPTSPSGDIVTYIEHSAFEMRTDATEKIKKVIIPDTVKGIGRWVFGGCINLESVYIGKGVTDIMWDSFYCQKLTCIVVDIENMYYQSIDGNIYSKDGTRFIQYAIGKKDTSYTILDGVTYTAISSFYGSNLVDIIIPKSVTNIDYFTFAYCTFLSNMYYCGTEDEWEKVNTGSLNDDLPDTTIFYYSETQPIEEGNFWHYVDGVPTVWGKDTVHVHDFDEFRHVLTSTCTSEGCYYQVCECGEYETYTIPMIDHTFDSDGKCTWCGKYDDIVSNHSQGLAYTSNDDGTCYVSGIGTCTDADIVIPSVSPDGLNVVSIGERAFSGCENITSIYVPNSIIEICYGAFIDCKNLSNLSGCKGVLEFKVDRNIMETTNVRMTDYNNCWYVEVDNNPYYFVIGFSINYTADSVILHEDTKVVGADAIIKFDYKSVYIPNGVYAVGYEGFYSNNITDLSFPDSLIYIGNNAFYCNYELTNVVITNNVTHIGVGAFDVCDKLKNVYFKGTADEWNSIVIKEQNDSILNATRYYYSETQPTTEGNFWHYVDGVPTVWDASLFKQ